MALKARLVTSVRKLSVRAYQSVLLSVYTQRIDGFAGEFPLVKRTINQFVLRNCLRNNQHFPALSV